MTKIVEHLCENHEKAQNNRKKGEIFKKKVLTNCNLSEYNGQGNMNSDEEKSTLHWFAQRAPVGEKGCGSCNGRWSRSFLCEVYVS